MASVIIVGDGPAGLSAGLFLAKNGHEAVVYGQDETAMHYAALHNYLGLEPETGTDFQERARQQVREHGARLVDAEVTAVSGTSGAFTVTDDSDGTREAGHLILAAGKAGGTLAEQLGIGAGPDGVEVDGLDRTGVDGVWAVGRLARPHRSQAIISAGAGAVAALDVMSREAGEDVHDWDTPGDA